MEKLVTEAKQKALPRWRRPGSKVVTPKPGTGTITSLMKRRLS